jgi:hypothetical protein
LRKRINQAFAKQENKATAAEKALGDLKKKAASTNDALQLTEIYTATQLERDLTNVAIGVDCKLTDEQLDADTKPARTSEQAALPPIDKLLLVGRRRAGSHSTVTLFAKLRGLSTSVPRAQAV